MQLLEAELNRLKYCALTQIGSASHVVGIDLSGRLRGRIKRHLIDHRAGLKKSSGCRAAADLDDWSTRDKCCPCRHESSALIPINVNGKRGAVPGCGDLMP